MKRDADLDELQRELVAEQLRWYRRENEQRDREDFEDRVMGALAKRWGYPHPQRRRR